MQNINSKKYWDDRFKTGDWDTFGGREQTSFFSDILLRNLPEWVYEKICLENLSIVDLGCAEGEMTKQLKDIFKNSKVLGVDFSKDAIEIARKRFANFDIEFEVNSIENFNKLYDVSICSNVLEHFYNPFEQLKKILKKTSKIAIIMMPFQEKNLHEEHFYRFDYNDYKMMQDNFYLAYYKIINTENYEKTYWPGKQILLIYIKKDYIELKELSLDKINNGSFEESLELQNKLEQRIEKNILLEQRIEKILKINYTYKNNIQETQKLLHKVLKSKSSKIIHLYNRLVHQLLLGSLQEKKKFIKWITKKSSELSDYRFNPIMNLLNVLEGKTIIDKSEKKNNKKIKLLDYTYKKVDVVFLSVIDWNFRYQRPQHLAKNISQNGNRVFYINANFSEQNKINKLTENLYNITLKKQEKLRIYDILEEDSDILKKQLDELYKEFNIRESIVILEYPTWYEVTEFLKNKYKSKIILDYIDDYNDFKETSENKYLKEATKKCLEMSDLVITTSDFLNKRASKYAKNTKIIRNGTEFSFFNKALREKKVDEKVKIGYYGAISSWFDTNKVEFIAKNRPDIEIELIGEVSEPEVENILKRYSNVSFLGEKKYEDLPNYLMNYDVCLIPFKDDIDLIKATNPVKFYEYLSAGKKVVATDIPELRPYEGNLVKLAKNKEEFLKFVNELIEKVDTEYEIKERIEFAKQNDWSDRAKNIMKCSKDLFEKVSIIIVTYNNLDLTKKCINSILERTAYPNYEIIIVDNASSDDTPNYLREIKEEYSNIKIKLNKENMGFASGNNQGIKLSDGKYYILLNNDTIVTRGWITGLIKHFENKKVGMVGSVTNSIGNEAEIKVDYKNENEIDEFSLNYTTEHYNEIYEDIEVLAMYCVALKKDIVNEIGLLDENYEIGMFEDDDYSYTLTNAGYELICAEDVFVHHFGRSSFKKMNNKEYKRIFERNKKYYEEKWNTVWIPHRKRFEL
ncbi:glycosyltransferase [Leptotrichia sp. oral taxon 879]|uniref:glycosyltransferase n=1 Tax=Leptotrichia sp. oral taxon 879 TaxID=1227267 RepID=UPI0003ADC017|nr:glycosyltransferase [Leptotrichia sp. oral taxon 879]ERK52108.1 glycosyltransferase, group 2 family protein [Leptotrichia sp. oral taxon 879 str. F0557]